MWKRPIIQSICAAILAIGTGVAASAQDYPSKPIKLVVGFGAGGMTDTSSRMIAEELDKKLGTRIVVQNQPGVGGLLALDAVKREPADGYTIVTFLSDSPFTAAYQGKSLNFDDWTMLGGYMPQERVLFGRQDNPFHSLDELISYAKKNNVTFADGGSFWSARVMEAFAKQNGLKMRLVPFKSGAEGSAAILGGHVMLAETGVGTPAWTSSKDKGLKILATLTPGGLADFGLPDVPTLKSAGANFVVDFYYGLAINSNTPPERVKVLRAALQEVIEDPAVQERFRKIDLVLKWMPGDAYLERMKEVAKSAAGLKDYLQK